MFSSRCWSRRIWCFVVGVGLRVEEIDSSRGGQWQAFHSFMQFACFCNPLVVSVGQVCAGRVESPPARWRGYMHLRRHRSVAKTKGVRCSCQGPTCWGEGHTKRYVLRLCQGRRWWTKLIALCTRAWAIFNVGLRVLQAQFAPTIRTWAMVTAKEGRPCLTHRHGSHP